MKSTNADIVISETWLSKSLSSDDINILYYNVHLTDRPRKVGGVANYVKFKFDVSMVLAESISNQMFLA